MISVLSCFLAAWSAGGGEIHQAANAGDLETVRALLKRDASLVKQRDPEGKTALHYAAAKGHLEIVKLLLDNGAEVNAPSNSGATPAYLAKGFGKKEVAALLVERGGTTQPIKMPKPVSPSRSIIRPPPAPISPIIEAAKSNNLARVLEVLAENPQAWTNTDAQGFTPLHHAADLGSVEITSVLLKAGASVSATNQFMATPLHLAAFRGRAKIVEMLLAASADVNARDFINATPLLVAAGAGQANDVVKVLLKAGAEVNARNKNSVSPLLLAASLNQPDGVAELLVGAGAEVNARENIYGYVPLHYAILRNNRALFDLLLARNADVNLANRDGETPLSLARFEANQEMAALLEKRGAKMPPERALKPLEQSLVDYYRGMHRTLTTSTFDEIRKMQSEVSPTQTEIAKLFRRNAEAASHLAAQLKNNEEVAMAAAAKNEKDKQQFVELMRNGARAGEYIRVEPVPPSNPARKARENGWLDPDAPAYLLQVTRRGGQTLIVGDFFHLGERWVLVPFAAKIFPELQK